jgi:putative endonuclease
MRAALLDWFSAARNRLTLPARQNTTAKQAAGDSAEALAAHTLTQAGLTILERNYRVRHGELDLVAEDGKTLVFVEVRMRREGASTGRFGGASASVGVAKQRRLAKAASYYLTRYRTPPACRFDVVLVGANTHDVAWMKDAFSLEGF